MLTPYDNEGTVIKVGNRARILCIDDLAFYGKVGTVALIDGHARVFVQMRNGGGMWWYSSLLLTQFKWYDLGSRIGIWVTRLLMKTGIL